MKARNWIYFVATVIIILLTSEICFATDDGDFQYWSSANVSLDIDEDWKITSGNRASPAETGRISMCLAPG